MREYSDDDMDDEYIRGYEAAMETEKPYPDEAFLKAVMHRFGVAGDFWKCMFTGAMGGDPACAAHVLAHCEFEHRNNEETI
jgi:hypothetical protein